MACPFFEPREAVPDHEGWANGRWPLIDVWRGSCGAGVPVDPPKELLEKCCNLGYARGICPNFPVDAKGDAVRFAPSGTANKLRIHYVIEDNYHPLEHGFADDSSNSVIRKQAEAFRGSYERRRPGKSHPQDIAAAESVRGN